MCYLAQFAPSDEALRALGSNDEDSAQWTFPDAHQFIVHEVRKRIWVLLASEIIHDVFLGAIDEYIHSLGQESVVPEWLVGGVMTRSLQRHKDVAHQSTAETHGLTEVVTEAGEIRPLVFSMSFEPVQRVEDVEASFVGTAVGDGRLLARNELQGCSDHEVRPVSCITLVY
ncbi:hypothetical protein HBI18_236980 [Parastagonospora nodorum]|nr:hypothetical protein HBI09_018710 [Parastagonospora nodorum]KAH5083717.1 hypothetical protein HBH95_036950 [Parastagonospora nodorum]KAH5708682.1 hypothetical protein HBI18_236980 [Parastagonospora nodorum]